MKNKKNPQESQKDSESQEKVQETPQEFQKDSESQEKVQETPQEEVPKRMTWVNFIDSAQDGSVCPYLKNLCIGPKCRFWIGEDGQFECSLNISSMALSALVAINSQLSQNLIEAFQAGEDLLNGDLEVPEIPKVPEIPEIPDLSEGE